MEDDDAKAKREAEEMKSKGNVAYKARNFDEAIELYQKAWDTWPKDVTFLTNLSGASWRSRPAQLGLIRSGVFRERRLSTLYRDVRKGCRGRSRTSSGLQSHRQVSHRYEGMAQLTP